MALANGKGSGMDDMMGSSGMDWQEQEPAVVGLIEASMRNWAERKNQDDMEWALAQQRDLRISGGMMWDELVMIARLWKAGIRPNTWESLEWELRAWDKTELQNVIELLQDHIARREA